MSITDYPFFRFAKVIIFLRICHIKQNQQPKPAPKSRKLVKPPSKLFFNETAFHIDKTHIFAAEIRSLI